mmetsp:Transcript_19503/g.29611  ORF Transcript_19503/g.29611 Transcript_19503/m.29611 type:complete len:186 (+) Transcript_19503:168-725(+)
MFYQATHLEDECMAICPPVSNPGFHSEKHCLLNKTLYRLCRIPHPWHNCFASILQKMASNQLLMIRASSLGISIRITLCLPMPVSISVSMMMIFNTTPPKHIKVNFMGDIDFFLNIAFLWQYQGNGHMSIHTLRSAFINHAAHCFGVNTMNPVPNMSHYCSGMTIDSIHPPPTNDPDLAHPKVVY